MLCMCVFVAVVNQVSMVNGIDELEAVDNDFLTAGLIVLIYSKAKMEKREFRMEHPWQSSYNAYSSQDRSRSTWLRCDLTRYGDSMAATLVD